MRAFYFIFLTIILFSTAAIAQPTAYGFLEFSGKVIRQQPVISWQTMQELSLDHFNIERSFDGSDFQTVASPAAKGRNTGTNFYSYTDASAAATSERIFYRLQCIDKNGDISYSSILKLQFRAHRSSLTIMGSGLIRNELHLNISATDKEEATIMISNQQGIVIKKLPVHLFNGSFIQPVDVSLLPKGLYFVSISTPSEILQQRFVMK